MARTFVRVCLTVLCLVTLATTASAEVKGIGVAGGVFDGDFGAQLRKDFWLGGDISQVTAQASVFFHNKTTFRLDADYHFMLNPDNPGRFYPLAGVDLAFNSDSLKLGANAGGGVNFRITESLQAFAEVKYVFSSWDGLSIMGGVYF
jgi:hypothetical protein